MRPGRHRLLLPGSLSLALSALLLSAACHRRAEPSPGEGPVLKVRTVEVQLDRVPDIHEVAGTVRPKLSATVAARVLGNIRSIAVAAGAEVREGDVLAKLDDRDLLAEFEEARADYDRYQKLLEKQAVTPAEFDAVQSRYRVAETRLSYATVTAPFAGVVAEKRVEVGDLAAPGKPLFVLHQPGAWRLEAPVPERFAAWVDLGQTVPVVIETTGEKCAGPISEVVPVADQASRSFLVKIDLPCREALKSGMFGRAQLPVGERTGIFVGRSAVRERGQLTYVFISQEGHARMRLVQTGPSRLETVEILSGLQPGEQLIVEAETEPADGQRIAAGER